MRLISLREGQYGQGKLEILSMTQNMIFQLSLMKVTQSGVQKSFSQLLQPIGVNLIYIIQTVIAEIYQRTSLAGEAPDALCQADYGALGLQVLPCCRRDDL